MCLHTLHFEHNDILSKLILQRMVVKKSLVLCSDILKISLMYCLFQDGEKVACRGYWGDIVNSPYLSFGIRSENKDLFKEQNGKIINVSIHVHVPYSPKNTPPPLFSLYRGTKYMFTCTSIIPPPPHQHIRNRSSIAPIVIN